MKRQQQLLLIGSTLAFSWLAMQAVHELGHVVGAMVSGGRVAELLLHPASISYTRLAVNPHPLFVVWTGPVVGVLLPLMVLLIARWIDWRATYLIQFFAGFCLVANGCYLAFGSFSRVGDAGDTMRHGTPMWLLWLFGLITIPSGLWLWNGLGSHFGLGKNPASVAPVHAYSMVGLLCLVASAELVVSWLTAAP